MLKYENLTYSRHLNFEVSVAVIRLFNMVLYTSGKTDKFDGTYPIGTIFTTGNRGTADGILPMDN